MTDYLFNLPRSIKIAIAYVTDVLFLIFALWFALSIRFETIYVPPSNGVWVAAAIMIVVSLATFNVLGLYRAITRYISYRALFSVGLGVAASAASLLLLRDIFSAAIPASAVITYGLIALLLIGGSRLLVRASVHRTSAADRERVLIYGAGSSGRQLAQALLSGTEYKPVAFVDDDTTLHRSTMLGLTVYPPTEVANLLSKKSISKILLAIPSASLTERKKVLEYIEPLAVQVLTIPGMADLVSGQQIDTLEEVRVEDLLGRDPVPPREHLMDRNIHGKVVLVTGAGGSIGLELCRQILRCSPKTLVLYELSEYSLYAINEELQNLAIQESIEGVNIVPIMGTIQRRNRVEAVMRAFAVQTVYHAAAYKHVPMVEYNIVEAVRNNVFGTWHTAEAAINAAVESFVLVSTDKAVRPTNVMGATKRMAELVLQALAKRQFLTCFCMVRFGNVLGSSGSVVPKFREQIKAGGPVTVTDPEITRYFMTIPEASQLVIQAGAMSCNGKGTGGEVFVLDMGEPVKIERLARKLIRLMGKSVKDEKKPNGDIEIAYSGLRPGEKLFEELLIGDNVQKTAHPRIMTALEADLSWPKVEEILQNLDMYCHEFRISDVHRILCEAPLGFAPTDGISDLVWNASGKALPKKQQRNEKERG